MPSGAEVAFVDVPGHERFVTTMLAGVGPVPAVLLVVAADEGWMPQSAEHVDALAALGVRHGLLVVTRSDLAGARAGPRRGPRPPRGHAARRHPRGLRLRGDRRRAWTTCAPRSTTSPPRCPSPTPRADVRLWVDRAFTIRGAGTVVTGTLPAGRLRVDDELELHGADHPPRRVTVRGLQSLGEPHDRVAGVARVAREPARVCRARRWRGATSCSPPARWLPTAELDVRLSGVRGAGTRPRSSCPSS